MIKHSYWRLRVRNRDACGMGADPWIETVGVYHTREEAQAGLRRVGDGWIEEVQTDGRGQESDTRTRGQAG